MFCHFLRCKRTAEMLQNNYKTITRRLQVKKKAIYAPNSQVFLTKGCLGHLCTETFFLPLVTSVKSSLPPEMQER